MRGFKQGSIGVHLQAYIGRGSIPALGETALGQPLVNEGREQEQGPLDLGVVQPRLPAVCSRIGQVRAAAAARPPALPLHVRSLLLGAERGSLHPLRLSPRSRSTTASRPPCATWCWWAPSSRWRSRLLPLLLQRGRGGRPPTQRQLLLRRGSSSVRPTARKPLAALTGGKAAPVARTTARRPRARMPVPPALRPQGQQGAAGWVQRQQQQLLLTSSGLHRVRQRQTAAKALPRREGPAA